MVSTRFCCEGAPPEGGWPWCVWVDYGQDCGVESYHRHKWCAKRWLRTHWGFGRVEVREVTWPVGKEPRS